MTDREQIQFLRGYCYSIGHTDGTPFDEATVSIYDVRPNSLNIISMKEIREMVEFYKKLPMLQDMGHVITPPEKFVYWMLKDIGILDGFFDLEEEMGTRMKFFTKCLIVVVLAFVVGALIVLNSISDETEKSSSSKTNRILYCVKVSKIRRTVPRKRLR